MRNLYSVTLVAISAFFLLTLSSKASNQKIITQNETQEYLEKEPTIVPNKRLNDIIRKSKRENFDSNGDDKAVSPRKNFRRELRKMQERLNNLSPEQKRALQEENDRHVKKINEIMGFDDKPNL